MLVAITAVVVLQAAVLGELPSFASFLDESSVMADLILPSLTTLERWVDDVPEPGVGFGVRTIGQPVVEPRWDTRDPGDVLIETAKALGGKVSYLLATLTKLVEAERAALAGEVVGDRPQVRQERRHQGDAIGGVPRVGVGVVAAVGDHAESPLAADPARDQRYFLSGTTAVQLLGEPAPGLGPERLVLVGEPQIHPGSVP